MVAGCAPAEQAEPDPGPAGHEAVVEDPVPAAGEEQVIGDRVLVDQAGRSVGVPEQIERVVALDTGLCGIILALGQWDTVVGTTRHTVLDDLLIEVIPGLEDVPTPGTSTDVSVESLLELEPDVVIGGWEIDFIH